MRSTYWEANKLFSYHEFIKLLHLRKEESMEWIFSCKNERIDLYRAPLAWVNLDRLRLCLIDPVSRPSLLENCARNANRLCFVSLSLNSPKLTERGIASSFISRKKHRFLNRFQYKLREWNCSPRQKNKTTIYSV